VKSLALAKISCGALAALSWSCSDSSPQSAREHSDQLYAVFTRLESEEGETSYLATTNSLASEAKLDLADALEAPGASRFYAPPAGGYFALGSNEDLTLTRYDIDAAGTPRLTATISFAQLGVTRLQHRAVFVSESKAYYIDNTQAQIVVFDPSAMEIVTTIRLPEQVGDGYEGNTTVLPYLRFPVVDGRLFIPVGWENDTARTARHATGLVVFDTTTDEVVSYTETEACPAATELAFDDNGDVYFGTNVNYPFYFTPDEQTRIASRPGCVLRIRAGEQAFDEDYLLRWVDLVDGGVAMGLTDGPEPGVGYVQVLDENVKPWAEIADEDTFWGEAAWRWWRVDLRNGTATLDDLIPASTPFMTAYEVDGKRYVARQTADSESELFELSSEGEHRSVLRIDGDLRGVARLY
jgi:hypothetical protein